jgi:hypothetical protein
LTGNGKGGYSATSIGTTAGTVAAGDHDHASIAGSAATLTTTRAINGQNFDGSAAITVPVNNADDTTDADFFVLFTGTQGGNYAAKTSAGLKYHASTGILSATGFAGALTGNVTGNVSGTAGNLTGTPALPNGTTATTQTAGDNSTKLATTAYVYTAVGGLAGGHDDVTLDTALTDILGLTDQKITAVDPGANRLVLWDDTAGKLTYQDPATYALAGHDHATSISGTAAGLTAQYIDWSSGSGGNSIKNKPTLGTAAATALDTDTTLAADSDSRVPSQKAVKAYVDAKVVSYVSGIATGSTDITAPGTEGDMTDMSITLTTKGTQLFIMFDAAFQAVSDAAEGFLYLYLDGAKVKTRMIHMGQHHYFDSPCVNYLATGQTPGSHTVKIRWKVTANGIHQNAPVTGERTLIVMDML